MTYAGSGSGSDYGSAPVVTTDGKGREGSKEGKGSRSPCIPNYRRATGGSAMNDIPPLTPAEHDLLFADDLAYDNVHAEWARDLIATAVLSIVAARLAETQAQLAAARSALAAVREVRQANR